MFQRRSSLAIACISLLFCSSLVAQKKDDKKQDDAQKKEVQNLVKLADDAAAGQGAPANDLSVTWVREDILKAQGNKQYIPFIVTVDPTKVTTGNLAFYWRVIAKNAQPTATTGEAADKKDNKDNKDKDKDKDKKKSDYAYEDVAFIPVTAGQPGPMRIARSFTVGAGAYDVVIIAREYGAQAQKNAAPVKTSVLKQTVNVPDFWNGELNTSSVIVAQRIDPLPAPLTPQQQADRPYALGQMEIVPQVDMTFNKKQELSTFMLVYNPKTDSANKPDVTVEYNFHTKSGNEWKFFNKTNPQNLNAQTLPPQFDLAAGHQLQSGQAVPLGSFPEGEYKLEIKVTDKVANKTLTRDVFFTVTAS